MIILLALCHTSSFLGVDPEIDGHGPRGALNGIEGPNISRKKMREKREKRRKKKIICRPIIKIFFFLNFIETQ